MVGGMTISDEAVEAAAKAVHGGDHMDGSPQRDAWLRDFRLALEAAAPHLLKNMRPMTLVELAARDRPESMEAARAKVRAARRESQSEMIREAKASGFEVGFTACAYEHMAQRKDPTYPITRINPFGATFADRMAGRSLDAVDHESWRAER